MKMWQKYPAEFLGTFILVLMGTTGIVAVNLLTSAPGAPDRLAGGNAQFNEIVVPLGFGLALLAGFYAFAEVSGGHFNPAVSLAAFLDGRISLIDLFGYWIFQFVGAIAASALMLVPFTQDAVATTATVPSPVIGDGGAFLLETAFTAIFVSVILHSTKSSRLSGSALVAIPLTLVSIHVALIPFTGASVNPARTLGPALIGDKWDSEWIYFLGPALGAIIAWLVYSVVVKGELGSKAAAAPEQPGSTG
jgi:aquaporin Z